MVEKELGERNFGFDSLKYPDMEEKGIVASDCLPLEPRFPLSTARACCRGITASALPPTEAVDPRQRGSGGKQSRSTITGNNPFLLHVTVNVLQGVEAIVLFPQFLLNHG